MKRGTEGSRAGGGAEEGGLPPGDAVGDGVGDVVGVGVGIAGTGEGEGCGDGTGAGVGEGVGTAPESPSATRFLEARKGQKRATVAAESEAARLTGCLVAGGVNREAGR